MAELAYQVTGFAYQGAGEFAYQGSSAEDVAPKLGGVWLGWQRYAGMPKESRAKIKLKREEYETVAAPVLEVIARQREKAFESMEAEETALRGELEAARLEYRELYQRILAFEREAVRLEEEGVIVMMMAAMTQ